MLIRPAWIAPLCLAWGCVTSVWAADAVVADDPLPRVTGTCLVAPDVLAITIEAGTIVLGAVVDYVPQAGDQITQANEVSTLMRAGAACGEVVGDGDKRQVITPSHTFGDAFRTAPADDAASYAIHSSDDPAYAAGPHPLAVHRKSKPTDYDWMQPPARHVLFLSLPSPLVEGAHYRVVCTGLNVRTPELTFANATRTTRSLAVHTTQIGYRVDDPVKRGYLSIWLGPASGSDQGGAYSYPAGLKFRLLDDASGAEVFTGQVEMAKRAVDVELMLKEVNFNGTDVLRMDFSAFTKPGRYRLYVDGIGCGYPFAIDDGTDTWKRAFTVQMRGFLHQRSGIALGPPFTTFVKPRDHHPDDGVVVLRSAYSQSIWEGSGEADVQKGLKELATTEKVTNAWGGWMDAGDWNPRRVTHMRATLAQLEVADLCPEFVAKLKLNIPRDYPVPDLFNEALFEIDCFRRMQTPDGGIGYGLETIGDGGMGQVSWHSKVLPVYMAAPDAGNSWLYASVAARAGRLLKPYDAAVAKVYADSAAKAMSFAESELSRQMKEKGKTMADLVWTLRDARNLAAIEMLRLTRDKHWHDVFMENTILNQDAPNLFQWTKAAQSDAAFAYALADETLTDPEVRKHAVQGLEMLARKAMAYADGNAFDIHCSDKYRPMFMGFYSTPWDGHTVLRAYHLTHNPAYLAAGVRACQFSSGANPDNLVCTTGLGPNSIRHPLKLDSRTSGQPAPEGITPYGIVDHANFPVTGIDWIVPRLDLVMWPHYQKWPVTESYTDTYCFIMLNEFTVDIWDESTWTWGYLAGRPGLATAKPAAPARSDVNGKSKEGKAK